jgi:single-stranded-DNA-specific exonuclease
VFNVTPKINTAGRMGDGNRAVELLTTQDSARASELAEELVYESKRRRKIQDTVLDDAIRKVNSEINIKNDKAIILADREWHSGVIGIVASKLKEEYNRPIIIISIGEDRIGKGSARSIGNFDMYDALTNTSRFLEGYGGHPMAAGLTVKEENVNNFRKTFLHYSKERLKKAELVQTIVLEGEIRLKDINSRFMTFLNKLEPYGPGNMRPKFIIRNIIIAGNPKVIGNGDHLKFKVRQGKTVYGAIGFNMSQHYEKLIKGCPLDIACLVEINEWRGQESIQLNVRDIKLSGKSYD